MSLGGHFQAGQRQPTSSSSISQRWVGGLVSLERGEQGVSRRASHAPVVGHTGEEGLGCLDVKANPHARRISRRAKGAPVVGNTGEEGLGRLDVRSLRATQAGQPRTWRDRGQSSGVERPGCEGPQGQNEHFQAGQMTYLRRADVRTRGSDAPEGGGLARLDVRVRRARTRTSRRASPPT